MRTDSALLMAEKLPRGQVTMRILPASATPERSHIHQGVTTAKGGPQAAAGGQLSTANRSPMARLSFAGDFKANLGRTDSRLAQRRPPDMIRGLPSFFAARMRASY
jgi:hypothetical protein